MVIGSHNSWSYLRPKKWWMRLIACTARCQREDIVSQCVKHNVRCLDLHVRFSFGADKQWALQIVHGPIVYENKNNLDSILRILNNYGDIYIRVILDVRTRQARHDYNYQRILFQSFCREYEERYPNIKFWCGRMVTGWALDYSFKNDPICIERYGSVTQRKWLWGWWPWLFARLHNKTILEKGAVGDILLMDYVDLV